MNQDTLVKIARSLLDAMTAHDLAPWEALLADDFIADYPCAPNLGRAAARAYNEPFLAAFPDLTMKVERVIAQGDTVVLDAFASGTFTRPLATPDGMVPPNGRPGGVRLVLIALVRNGKIVHEQTVWNQLDLFQQLGLIPSSRAA
jgi:steroid delta-isomerase-like uncharacterized protein